VIYSDGECFGKKQVHNFRTLENCYRCHSFSCVILDFRVNNMTKVGR